MSSIKIFLFKSYSWIYNIMYFVIELTPPFLRYYFFQIALGKMGSNSFIDYKTYVRYPSKVFIGNNVMINRNCSLIPGLISNDSIIVIEDNTAIGPNVVFLAAGHDHTKLSLPDIGGRIKVHKFCWIGGNSTILQGVEIGEGSVIGAGSVVTKDIPPYSIAVGIPAKVIKKRILNE